MKRRTKLTKAQEAKAAIARLQATLAQGDNRFGEYGRNCRQAIEGWQKVLDREAAAGRAS